MAIIIYGVIYYLDMANLFTCFVNFWTLFLKMFIFEVAKFYITKYQIVTLISWIILKFSPVVGITWI